jgi:HAD superfamily hydrolase (TIGR01509 family)
MAAYMTYEAILFDMDGVVIDTHKAVTNFWDVLASQHTVQLSPAIYDQYIYGSPAAYTLDHVFPGLSADEREVVIQRMLDYETNQSYIEVQGITALLRDLKCHGVPTALVTSGARWKVDEVVRQLALDGLFTTDVTADNIQQGKPHPECYLLAARKLQTAPERCLVFEDSINGAKAAVASGALCIGVRPASMAAPLFEIGVRYVIADFAQARFGATSPNQRELRLDSGYSLMLSTNTL